MSITASVVALPHAELRVLAAGPVQGDPIVFLHGWPQDASAWSAVMGLAATDHRCLAIDLPGIGSSRTATPRGDKEYIASVVRDLIAQLHLHRVTVVGHDIGGMAVFRLLKGAPALRAAVIMDTVIPGVPPWDDVISNPFVWHFAFHTIAGLPERLVAHDVRAYFDYFFTAIAARPEAITDAARERYVASYSSSPALTQGFEWYRALWGDAEQNAADRTPVDVPTLMLRGSADPGDLAAYEQGLRDAGLRNLTARMVDGAGHFTPEEAPQEVWRAISEHLATAGSSPGVTS